MNWPMIKTVSVLALPTLVAVAGCETSRQDTRGTATQSSTSSGKSTATKEATIPIVKENLQVGKREVQEGTTRVQKRVVETPIEKNITLKEEDVRVERRAANRPVQDADQAFRNETIEMTETKEVPMVSKEARVTGEVALKKDTQERRETVRETVRNTDVQVLESGQKEARGGEWSSYEPEFRKNYEATYANSGLQYEQVRPAYQQGYELAKSSRGSDWSAVSAHGAV
jgi:uncharacterized protein (TIGR02271 family)